MWESPALRQFRRREGVGEPVRITGAGVPVGDPGARLCCICCCLFGSVHAQGQLFA
jgi:hypothetical protein